MKTTLMAFCLLLLCSCGSSGGDDEPDTVVVVPTPTPSPTQCNGNTASCDQADSTVEEAAEAGVEDISFTEDEDEEIPGLNQDAALRECTIIICSNGVNVGNTTTVSTTNINTAERWAGVTSVEVVR